MSYLPGKFVWFEHLSNNMAAARKFYEPLLRWHVEMMPMGEQRYPMILNGNRGIGGFGKAESGARNAWMSYLSVDDVDTAFAAALSAGASSLVAPMDFGGVGRGASIADPTGAVLSLWRSAEGDQPDAEQSPDASWCWNELWTSSPEQAVAFYQRVFGYEREDMDMGAQGRYTILKKDGISRGGVTRSANQQAPSMWLPYLTVDDCDVCAAKAKALGAQILSAPTDVPHIGRYAILSDPVGAAIAMIKPQRD